VSWNGKTSEEKVPEHYPVSRFGARNDLVARHLDRHLRGECTRGTELLDIVGGDGKRLHPLACSFLVVASPVAAHFTLLFTMVADELVEIGKKGERKIWEELKCCGKSKEEREEDDDGEGEE
jgi:hypothetical protein